MARDAITEYLDQNYFRKYLAGLHILQFRYEGNGR